MDAQNDNRSYETTNPVAKSGMQRTSTHLLLYGFGLSTNLCMGLRPSIFSFSSPTPPPVLALLYIVLSAGGLSAGGQRTNPRHRPDEQGRPSQEGASGFQCPRVTAAPPRFRRTEGTDGTYDSLAEATTSRKRGARGCGRRIPGRARRAAGGLRCDARLGRGRSGGRWNRSWAGEGRMNPRNAPRAGRVGMEPGSCSVLVPELSMAVV